MIFIEKKIGDIAQLVKTGKTPPSKIDEYYNGDVNWYNPGDLDKNKYLSKSKRTITKLAVNDNKATLLPKNTVLIGCIGDIGKLGIATVKSCSNQQLTGVLTNDEVYFEYFYYWLKRNKTTLQNKATNAIVPILNNKNLNSIKIKFPKSLTNQKRIAKVLSDAEQLIAQRKESIALLDELLKSTFLDMFGDPKINPNKFTSEHLSKFYLSPKTGTKCGPFGSALKKDEYTKNGIPVWNMDNITKNGRFIEKARLWIDEEKYNQLTGFSTQNEDIIISRAGTVGKMCVLNSKYSKSIISTNLIRLRLNSAKILPIYFVSLMTYCKGRVGRLKTGADGTFTHMNTGILDKLKFPIPPIELQTKFAQIVEKTEAIKKHYQESLQELKNLYGSLSQRAFKGELDLSGILLEK